MPRALPDELMEEVLRRLPPQEPAELVRAALVSRRWCCLVSDPGFRRRFREFHRRPPMLGMLCNFYDDNDVATARFIPTTAFCSPHTRPRRWRALDARHGRVLFHRKGGGLLVWDPMTDEVRRELPFPQNKLGFGHWTAAVLCSAAAGACAHLDCHRGPFLVVFVCSQHGKTVVYTYSSDAATWSESEPVFTEQSYLADFWTGSALVGNSLYFRSTVRGTALKYDLELCQVSLILLPSSVRWRVLRLALPTTTEDGGLGLIYKAVYNSNLYMWSRKDTPELDAKWERRVIILKEALPADVDVATLDVIGCGVSVIFMSTGDEVYAIDLKTHEVKKVYEGTTDNVIPYMSFCTPALKGTCTGEGPSTGHSSACKLKV